MTASAIATSTGTITTATREPVTTIVATPNGKPDNSAPNGKPDNSAPNGKPDNSVPNGKPDATAPITIEPGGTREAGIMTGDMTGWLTDGRTIALMHGTRRITRGTRRITQGTGRTTAGTR